MCVKLTQMMNFTTIEHYIYDPLIYYDKLKHLNYQHINYLKN